MLSIYLDLKLSLVSSSENNEEDKTEEEEQQEQKTPLPATPALHHKCLAAGSLPRLVLLC